MNTNLNVGMRCIKYMLFISNFMFLMVGVLLISFGSTIKTIYNDFELFMEDHFFSPAILVIAVGVIILLIAAFGCAAAIKESTCMVNMFALMLLCALVLEMSASIAAYAMRGNLKDLVADKMVQVQEDYLQNHTESQEAFDFMQKSLACCGVNNYHDWDGKHLNVSYYNETINYPASCCDTRRGNGSSKCNVYVYGCLDRLTFIISESAIMLGTGALCIAFVQVLGIAFAVMLAKSIRRLKTQQAAARWQTRQELYLQLARGNEKPASTPVVYTANEAQAE